MGIPHFTATLEPYAVRRLLRDETAVIDGPALAYHMLHVCRANGIAQPSYRLVCQCTVAWLEELARHQVTVQAIYFDGYLPTSKREVRMQRLMNVTAQINRFFSANPRGCPRNQLAVDGQDDGLDVFRAGLPNTKAPFADPSFFVPAIIEALRQTPKYKDQTLLVPGEADAYCASHVRERGGVVLTSDSDLLAYSLGHGQVVFFRSIHRDAGTAILCSSFTPSHISQTLGLSPSEGPPRLAYERKRAPHATLPQLVRACSNPVLDPSEYQAFRQQYQYHDGTALPLFGGGRLPPIDGLDPRLSELVVQLNGFPNQDNARFFLPVLVESPSRGSAWEQSTPVRQLAYTLLKWGAPEPSSPILEYRRVQSTLQKGRKVETLSTAEARQLVDEVSGFSKRIKEIVCGCEAFYWPLVCLAIDIRGCQKQSKHSHAWDILQQRLEPSMVKASKINWDVTHFLAQLQAAFYSLRILRQVLSVTPDSVTELSPSDIRRLQTALLGFPPLTTFPDLDSIMELLVWFGKNELVRALSELLHLPVPSSSRLRGSFEAGPSTDTRPANKRHDGNSQELGLKSNNSRMNNMFSFLPAD